MFSLDEFYSNQNGVKVISNDIKHLFANYEELGLRINEGLTRGKVCVVSSELNFEINNAIRKLSHDGVTWFIPGFMNDFVTDTRSYQWHIWHTCMYNNGFNSENFDSVKPYFFDALLGSRKEHRTFVYQQIIENNLTNKVFVKYHGNYLDNISTVPLNSYEHFIWPHSDQIPELDVIGNPIITTTTNVMHNGKSARLSCIIPTNVYDQTCYSIVAESMFENDYSFFTEKIAKPLLAKRLFVVFSGYKYLENLRKLGFRTFDNVIDESYDSEKDNHTRFSMAFDQVKFLCNVDQQTILDKIKPICEHNYEVITNTDWAKNFL